MDYNWNLQPFAGHSCSDYPYIVSRSLRSGARVLRFDCGHIELRQKSEYLPDPTPRKSLLLRDTSGVFGNESI